MKKLTSAQMGQLHGLLIRNGSNDALTSELIDHLACEVETYLWKGYSFELALEKVSQQANQKAILYLRQTYQHECAMSDEQLKHATLDEIVFEFRNKEYGAYDLRQAYPKALQMGLFGGIGLFCMIFALWSGFTTRSWDLLSANNVLWVAGVSMLGYAGWLWYSQYQKKQYVPY